jgi:hypothetical protein
VLGLKLLRGFVSVVDAGGFTAPANAFIAPGRSSASSSSE